MKVKYFIFILLMGAFFRFYAINSQSLWSDEIFIVYYLFPDFFTNIKTLWFSDNSPPLYVVLLKIWSLGLGLSELSVRSFSALLGTITIYWFFKLVRLFTSLRCAFIGASLFAISPLAVYYSQEVRYYALWLLFSTLSFYYFFKWFHFGEKKYLLWVFVTILALYTHIFSIFILFIQAVLFFKRWFENRSFSFVKKFPDVFWLYLSLIVICSLPLIWWAFLHIDNQAGFSKPFSLSHFAYVPFTWVFGYSFGPSVRELHFFKFTEVLSNYGVVVVFAMVILLVTVFMGVKEAIKDKRLRDVFLISVMTLCTIVLTPLFSNITFNVRSTLFLLPFFFIILSIGVDNLLQKRVLWFVPVLMVFLMLFSLFQYYHNPKYARDDLRSAAAIISEETDIAVITSYMANRYVLSLYYENDQQTYRAYSWEAIDELRDEKKLWLIWNRMWMYKDASGFREYFQQNYRVVSENNFPGVSVQLVEKK